MMRYGCLSHRVWRSFFHYRENICMVNKYTLVKILDNDIQVKFDSLTNMSFFGGCHSRSE